MSAPTRCTIAARVEQGTRFFPRSAAALNVPPGRGPRRWGSPPPWNPARRRHPLPRFRFPASLDPARSPLACQESGEHIAAASNRSVAASALSLLPPRGGELNKSGQPAGPLSPAAPRTTHMWSLKLYGKEAWKEVIGSPWRHSGQFGRATLGAQLAAIFGEKKKKKKKRASLRASQVKMRRRACGSRINGRNASRRQRTGLRGTTHTQHSTRETQYLYRSVQRFG